VHRRQDRDVAPRVEAELGRYPGAGHVDGQRRSGFGVVAGEQEEVGQPGGERGLAGVDAVGVGHDPGLGRLAEHLGQPHPRDRLGGEQVAQHLPGADGRELVDVTDQQHMPLTLLSAPAATHGRKVRR